MTLPYILGKIAWVRYDFLPQVKISGLPTFYLVFATSDRPAMTIAVDLGRKATKTNEIQ